MTTIKSTTGSGHELIVDRDNGHPDSLDGYGTEHMWEVASDPEEAP